MEFGAHLPVLSLAGEPFSVDRLGLWADDVDDLHRPPRHPRRRPDGQGARGHRRAIRGRLIVGAGPGSSPKDYETVGLPFEERWRRFDEQVPTLRRMWKELEPHPTQDPIPVWIGSWGSEAGLRRTARLGDGWLASAYNTTPAKFGDDLKKLRSFLRNRDRDAPGFPNGIATMFFYVTNESAEADEVLTFLSGVMRRPAAELRDRFLVGAANESIEKIRAFQGAGAQRILVWPVRDELPQLELFMERIGRHV